MSGLCAYKDLIGKPNTGIHKYRLFDIAVMDVVITFFAAWLFAYIMKWNAPRTILSVFIIGIISHRIFCVRTTVDKWLFPNSE